MKYIPTLLILVLFGATSIFAQQSYTVESTNSTVSVLGTSTIHDWESIASVYKGDAEVQVNDSTIEGISSLSFTLEAESIKSGKRGMDKNTYGALNTKDHPYIVFNLQELKSATADSLHTSGTLEVSGKQQAIDLSVAYVLNDDGSITFSGNHPFLMTDFDVDPPSALLGTVRAGNEVNIKFSVNFTSKNL